MSETTNNQDNSSSAKTHVLAGFSGQMTVVFETVGQYGGPAGKKVGAIYNVVNGVIVEVIEYYNEPSASDMERLEKAAVGLLAGVVGGIVVAELLPAGAIAIVGAGIVAVVVEEGSDIIYEGYVYWKEKAFWLLDKFQHGILEPTLNSIKNLVTTATTTRSPIAIDLDGDGIETIALADGAYFDHDGNGFAEQTGWVSGDDGLLVRDINNDGIINDGKELFGDQTILSNGTKASNGFQALSEIDDNHDGRIDANDTAYSQLKVWQDTDGDGYTSEGELKTLDELGIQSINTGYTSTEQTDPNGNTIKQTGSFTKTDGTTGNTADVYFQVDKTNTIANEWLDVPDDIAALPNLQGYGNVYDLQQAMVRDTSGTLKGLVEQFMNETDSEIRHALITQILYKWTGVENVDPLSRAATKIYGNVIKNHTMPPLSFLTGDRHDGKWYKERKTNIMLRLAA